MLDVLRTHLAHASEFSLSVSFLRSSGLQLVAPDLRAFAARGGRARVLTSTYLGYTQPDALRVLSGIDGIEAKLQFPSSGREGFHPKFMIFDGVDGSSCWVGSSNLSKGGLTSNIEANLKQDDPEVVAHVLAAFDDIWMHEGSLELNDWVIAYYERTLQERQRATWQPPIIAPTRIRQTGPEPNEAQNEALVALARLRRLGERKAVAVAATGVGKTYLAAFDAKAMEARSVLFVSHRLEHLVQAKQTFEKVFAGTKTTGLVYSRSKEHDADLVFSTVRSAVGSHALMRRHFDYVVVDECHHATARTYRRILSAVDAGFVLGLTATPERADQAHVAGLFDDHVAFRAGIAEGIALERLVPFDYVGLKDTIAFDPIPWRSYTADRLSELAETQERMEALHEAWREHPGSRTLVFCTTISHADFVARWLTDRGLRVVACHSGEGAADREASLEALSRGELDAIASVDLFNEGIDVPRVDRVIMLRPTTSPVIFLELISKEVVRENMGAWQRVERIDLGEIKERRQRWENCCPMSSGRGSNRTCRL